jgi:MFS family permease
MAISFLFGVGLAAVGPTLMSYVADISPASHLGRSYGWYTTAIYTGMSLGPALGGWLAQGLGFRSLFSLSGFFVLVLGGTALVILPRRPATARPDRPGAVPVSTLLRHNRGLQGCWLGTLGSCFGWGVFLTFAPLQMHNCGLTLGQIGLVCAVQTGINAISRLPLGRLSDRVQERWRLAGLGLVCFAASLAAFGAAATLRQFFLAAVALGVSMGLTFTPMGALVAEVVPPQAKGVAMGGYNTCIYLGMMLGSACLGGLIEKWGYGASFVGTALVVLLFTGVFYLLLRDVTPPQGNRQ